MSRWKDVPVLVTGAQGFIGSWVAERLADEGARVVVPRRDAPALSRFRLAGLESRCDVVQADILDYEAMARILNEFEVRAVFHLAAQAIVTTANASPLSTWEANVRGTYTLLEACRANAVVRDPIERIVVASSDKAYGNHDQLPYGEDFALQPRYPYDVSKACTDMIARSYAITFGMPVGVTRLANVYGGGDFNFSRIVPDTMKRLVEGDRPLIRSDGSPERDYIYADDAVSAYLRIGESLDSEENYGRAWNAGAGKAISVREMVDAIVAVSGKDAKPEITGTGTPDGEIDRQFLDSARIKAELGWAPKWALEDGLRETYGWYEAQLEDQ